MRMFGKESYSLKPNHFWFAHPEGEFTMSRLSIPALDDVPEAAKPILAAVHKQLGVVPNMYRLIAQSPATLQGFTSNNAALSKTLDVKTRERIALAGAPVDGCDHCLPAPTHLRS